MYYCYLARCADKSLYCGQTTDLRRRLTEHNENNRKSARYTKSRRPVTIVYFEEYPTLSLAMKREKEIKKLPKNLKEKLVNSHKSKGEFQAKI